jgi:hypothetical protein
MINLLNRLQLILPNNIHPELLRNTNRSETTLQKFPVGTNQYLAAGFQRTGTNKYAYCAANLHNNNYFATI